MSLPAPAPTISPDAPAADDDRALVRRFAESRDEAAFARVVERHARMVYGVCRRAVRDAHLAEDAFQAVFLVLANHPARATKAAAVGGWLFGVARRVGLAARRREQRHARRAAAAAPREANRADFGDLLRVLDEEIAALPDEFRAPLVACFLEERTLDEAARHLGWSVSTLRRRLDRAKQLLRARLTRRGATLAGGLFAGFLAQTANAAVPARVLVSAGARPSALARTLASEFAGRSIAVKAGLASVALALGIGGLAVGVGADAGDRGPDGEPAPAESPRTAVAPAPRAAETARVALRGRVVFPDGRPLPAVREVPAGLVKDFEFFGPQTYRDVLINPETRGVANAVVWLRPDPDDGSPHAHRPHTGPVDRPVVATRDGFRPRVVAARAGDRLVFSNPTPVPFTVHYQRPTRPDNPAAGLTSEFNVLLPPGRTHTTRPLPAIGAPDTVTDNIHAWVEARVWAFDHPYFAVTDADGGFEIASVPAGTWRLVVWHEKAVFGTAGRAGRTVIVAPEDGLKVMPLESANWGGG